MRNGLLVLVLLAAGRPALAQQCPDGTPPPCAARPTPPPARLDPNKWLVLPFENRSAQQEASWLREGTATLLRLELERWPELKVVDEAAVTDQLRRLRLEGRPITLGQARAIARSFGAGNLVLGQVVPGPRSVRVLARAYSTGSGRRAREATAVTALTDSAFTGAMGSVAADLLDLPRDPEFQGPAAGTQSLAAYREFVLGRESGRRMEYDSAAVHYRRAIALDSTFALAYYAAYSNGIRFTGGRTGRDLALAALRNSTRLPLPIRRKIAAAEAASRMAYGEACRLHRDLLGADSSDTDVIFGSCVSCCCDALVSPDSRSPSGFSFRTSLQTVLWALRRAIEVDSTLEWPYQGASELLAINPLRPGCLGAETEAGCPLERQMTAYILLDHDSVATVPWPVGRYPWGRPVGDTTPAGVRLRQTRAKVEMAQPLIERWRSVNPDSRRQRVQYTNVAQALGQPEAALPVIRDFASPRRDMLMGQLHHAFEVLLQLERPQEAVVLYDSLMAAHSAAMARGDSTLQQLGTAQLWAGPVRGRVSPSDPALGAAKAQEDLEVARREFALGPDSLLRVEADSGRQIMLGPRLRRPDGRPTVAGDSAIVRMRLYLSVLGFHERRTLLLRDTAEQYPEAGGRNAVRPPVHRVQVRLASGDTAGARELLRLVDYQLFLGEPSTQLLTDAHIWAAESYLELGDSAAALERMRDFARKLPNSQLVPLGGLFSTMMGAPTFYFLPRFWIRYGDLAYALHHRDEAIRAYRLIEGLWADADPVFQPTVQRARTRLAELTARGTN